MYFDQDVNTTWEGDNNMLLQQTTKYVLKEIQKRREKEDPTSLLNFVNSVTTILLRTLPYLRNGPNKTCYVWTTWKKSFKNGWSK